MIDITTQWEIASRVESRLDNLPSDLGSSVIVTFVEDAVRDVENIANVSISADLTSIGSKYHPAVTDLATAYTVARKMMAEIDIDAKVGQIQASYSNLKSADSELLKFYVDRANMSMKNIERGGRFFVKVVPST